MALLLYALRSRLECVLVLLFFVTAVTSLNVTFPSSPAPAETTISFAWSREKQDPNVQFFFQKVQLDETHGPGAKSPVPVPDSRNNNGTAPIFFDNAGLFELLAVDAQNSKPFYATEISVVVKPTLTTRPTLTLSSSSSTSTSGITANNYDISGSASATQEHVSSSTAMALNIPSNTSASPTPTGTSISSPALIIGVGGGVTILFSLGAIILCLRRRHASTSHRMNELTASLRCQPCSCFDVESQDSSVKYDRITHPYKLKPAMNTISPRSKRNNSPCQHRDSQWLDREKQVPSAPIPSVLQNDDTTNFVERSSNAVPSDIVSHTPPYSPTLPLRLTKRQAQIQEEAGQLRLQILSLDSAHDTSLREMIGHLIGRVSVLEARADSDWARELTDEPPDYSTEESY